METWKDVPGYNGDYQVSTLGRVKSLKFGVEHIIKPISDGRGYNSMRLYLNGKAKTMKVHKIVAITFLDHVPDGHNLVVDHINDDKLDNRLENLQIVTARFNCRKTQGPYSSKYKGVYFKKDNKKWNARIYINGRYKHLGYFTNQHDAYLAYESELNSLHH